MLVDDHVMEIWGAHRQIDLDSKEAFGALIGSCSLNEDVFWIEAVTTPGPGDRSERRRFSLKDHKHQRTVDKAFLKSQGQSVYLGTWHTHPENVPQPSGVDVADWRGCMQRNPARQLFFAIVGTYRIHIYVAVGDSFRALTLKNGGAS